MLELFNARVAQSGDRVALRYKAGAEWKSISWNDWAKQARRMALGLAALGVGPGDRVSILSATRPEWVFADIAILMAGATTVPIYPSNLPDQCEYILNNSESKVVFAEDAKQLAKLETVRSSLSSTGKVVLLSGSAPQGADWVVTLADMMAAGDSLADTNAILAARAAALEPATPLTFVYTSGTTGNPKGVVLTHANFVFECEAADRVFDIHDTDEQLLFLPLAHIFAKLLYMMALQNGHVIAFAESIEKVVQNLGEVRPTFVGSVPRIYEKVYTKVTSGAQEAGGMKLKIFNWAMKVGRQVSQRKQRGEAAGGLAYALATKLVFSKLHKLFGGRLRFFISGGAPLSRDIAEFFHAAGITILEGYGLTETTAATHVNRLDKYKFGTVGPAIPGVEVKIASDGEILMRGPNIMVGYYKRAEDTAEAIDAEGWFHSGDIGEVDKDGFLRITDRKKDLIVNAGGKNIAPQNVENLLKTEGIVSQAMLVGDKKPFCVALITVNEENARKLLGGANGKSYADVAGAPEVRAEVERAIARVNQKLASYEQVKKFSVLPNDFTQETGELTPTLKVKRKFATQKYQQAIDQLYS
jgi:long-chain acyl-CoA synthetase